MTALQKSDCTSEAYTKGKGMSSIILHVVVVSMCVELISIIILKGVQYKGIGESLIIQTFETCPAQ